MNLKNYIKRLIKRSLPYSLKHQIYNLMGSTLDLTDHTRRNMYDHIELLKKIGFEPSYVIDVGAYIGEWTTNVSSIYPNSNFLMIEAQASKESNLKRVKKNVRNVDYEIALLGECHKEEVKFYEMETGSSIYEENTDYKRKNTHFEMKTLDDMAKKYKITENDSCFLKLDVQGAEIDVLKGGLELLCDVEILLIEVSTLNYNKDAPLFAEVISYLESKNFVLFDVCDERRKKNNVLFQLDLILIKKDSELRKSEDFKNKM